MSIAAIVVFVFAAWAVASEAFARGTPTYEQLRIMVADEAQRYGLDERLMVAIITVESGWKPWASHFESNYKRVRNLANYAAASGVSIDTERQHQRTAFGLMQIVGGTARALRDPRIGRNGEVVYMPFVGPLTRLYDPKVNLHWGAIHLRQLVDRYPNSQTAQIAAWNAGGAYRTRDRTGARRGPYVNQRYVDMVVAHLRRSVQLRGCR